MLWMPRSPLKNLGPPVSLCTEQCESGGEGNAGRKVVRDWAGAGLCPHYTQNQSESHPHCQPTLLESHNTPCVKVPVKSSLRHCLAGEPDLPGDESG